MVAFLENEPLAAAVVGSSNYGVRSGRLDVESNCVLVLTRREFDEEDAAQRNPLADLLTDEWNRLCERARLLESSSSSSVDDASSRTREWALRLVLPVVKRFL